MDDGEVFSREFGAVSFCLHSFNVTIKMLLRWSTTTTEVTLDANIFQIHKVFILIRCDEFSVFDHRNVSVP